jgi:hypothetical protein
MTEMYRAASGDQQEAAKRGVRADIPITAADSSKFKVFFPSQRTLEQSRGGARYPLPPNTPDTQERRNNLSTIKPLE